MRNKLTRRDFLKGTLAASATLASMSLLGCSDAVDYNETTAAHGTNDNAAIYDEEYDVVVIGHGFHLWLPIEASCER